MDKNGSVCVIKFFHMIFPEDFLRFILDLDNIPMGIDLELDYKASISFQPTALTLCYAVVSAFLCL